MLFLLILIHGACNHIVPLISVFSTSPHIFLPLFLTKPFVWPVMVPPALQLVSLLISLWTIKYFQMGVEPLVLLVLDWCLSFRSPHLHIFQWDWTHHVHFPVFDVMKIFMDNYFKNDYCWAGFRNFYLFSSSDYAFSLHVWHLVFILCDTPNYLDYLTLDTYTLIYPLYGMVMGIHIGNIIKPLYSVMYTS